MTSEDRELEIKDQLHFLDRVYEQFLSPMNREKLRIHALGFSQGVATLTRWLNHRKPDIDSIIFWAGTAPFAEIEARTEPFSRVPWYFLVGDEDEFLPEKAVQRHLKNLEEKSGRKIRLLRYKGRHRIEAEALRELVKLIGAAS
jgi:predicted esterase